MNLKYGRATLAAGIAAVAAITLGGCGSDNNSGSAAGGGSADCAGKNALTAEGSTAQQNAIALFNQCVETVLRDPASLNKPSTKPLPDALLLPTLERMRRDKPVAPCRT